MLPEDELCGTRGAGVTFCAGTPLRSSGRKEEVGLVCTGCPTTGEGNLELMPLPHTELAKGAGVEKAVLAPEDVVVWLLATGSLFATGGGGVPCALAPENSAG